MFLERLGPQQMEKRMRRPCGQKKTYPRVVRYKVTPPTPNIPTHRPLTCVLTRTDAWRRRRQTDEPVWADEPLHRRTERPQRTRWRFNGWSCSPPPPSVPHQLPNLMRCGFNVHRVLFRQERSLQDVSLPLQKWPGFHPPHIPQGLNSEALMTISFFLLVLYCSQLRKLFVYNLCETSLSKHFHIIHSFEKIWIFCNLSLFGCADVSLEA